MRKRDKLNLVKKESLYPPYRLGTFFYHKLVFRIHFRSSHVCHDFCIFNYATLASYTPTINFIYLFMPLLFYSRTIPRDGPQCRKNNLFNT